MPTRLTHKCPLYQPTASIFSPLRALPPQLTGPDGRWRYPVVFMTNGGGTSEARKAQQLTEWLGVPVSEQQVGEI